MARCEAAGCMARGVHRHHVVYEQHLRREWDGNADVRKLWPRYAMLKNDPRNLMDLCVGCHLGRFGHHRLSVKELSEDALDFAFELLGPKAYDYLRRRYAGDDPRLETRLDAAEEATT